MKVLIADDHAVVREGVKQILLSLDEIEGIDEASEGNDALRKLIEKYYDMAIIDISMPGVNGLDILREVRNKCIDTRIVVLSLHSSEQYARYTMNLGAFGYISKDSVYEELCNAILCIINGNKYIPVDFYEKAPFSEFNGRKNSLSKLLTKREMQLYKLMVDGHSDAEISQRAGISEQTLRNVRVKIFKKIGVKNQSELIIYANKNRLIN